MLGIHLDGHQRIDSAVAQAAQQELDRLLSPAGIHVALDDRNQYNRLVVASFDGDCSVAELQSITFTPKSNKLADTAIGSEGGIRPFFRVDCARVIWTLRPMLDHLNVPARNIVFGRAMARVMAHEIYHVLAAATDHAEAGIAKPSLSFEDLVSDRFGFDASSLDRIHDQTNPRQIAVDRAN
jgi:hypothetical protein